MNHNSRIIIQKYIDRLNEVNNNPDTVEKQISQMEAICLRAAASSIIRESNKLQLNYL